jgi:hypothetical protein
MACEAKVDLFDEICEVVGCSYWPSPFKEICEVAGCGVFFSGPAKFHCGKKLDTCLETCAFEF